MIRDAAVGKSSLLNRLIRKSFEPTHQPTIGAAYEQHVEQVGQECIHMRIWDTGQE
jgi:GTPase SAR1 family protein